jgi:DNA-binding CsgD family transcriptional regulator
MSALKGAIQKEIARRLRIGTRDFEALMKHAKKH